MKCETCGQEVDIVELTKQRAREYYGAMMAAIDTGGKEEYERWKKLWSRSEPPSYGHVQEAAAKRNR
jgi:hypothetical protein